MTATFQAYRFELDPNNGARSALASHAGAARFAFNWGRALVIARLAEAGRLAEQALAEGASAREAEAFSRTVVVPWSLAARKSSLPLAERTYRCDNPGCANHGGLDRDLNAALNLAALVSAVPGTGSGPGTGQGNLAHARGEERSMGSPRCSSTNCEDGTSPPGPDKTVTATRQQVAPNPVLIGK